MMGLKFLVNAVARKPALLALALALPLLQGCPALIVGGVATGVLVADDRRTIGAQTDDKAIGLKVDQRINEAFGERAHINVNPYNRRVLLTGEVPDEKAKADVARLAGEIENVSGVVNEVRVGLNSPLVNRSNDAFITSKVKGNFVDDAGVQVNTIKVVTEAGAVYLMGLVTHEEGDRAAAVAARTSGVAQVVRVFEYIATAPRQPGAAPAQPAEPVRK
jgi:osmotically-inducible protein OsmY